MRKAKALRITGFLGALCASATLVGFAATGTGAYFTDSHDGAINAGTGHIRVDVSPADLQLNFDNLLPGEYQTQRVDYAAHPSSGSEDLWLVFPSDGSADAFIHTPQAGPAPLGRYGHFKLTSTGGASFESSNLTLDPAGGGSYNTSESCSINANGEGGSPATANSPSDLVPYCAPMHAILLQSGMHDGDTGYANVEFGFTKILKNGQDSPRTQIVKYKIVATQHGIRPDDPSNG